MPGPTETSPPGAPVRSMLVLLLAAAGVAIQVGEARAQYFGRNQVQYETFDFQVLGSEHFDVYYYEEEDEAATQAARMAERWYARLSRLLDHSFEGKQPFILYANHPHFRQTTALTGAPGEGTGGVTEPLKRRIVLPMAGPLEDTDHVIGHELVHGFQFDMTGISPRSPLTGTPAISALPLWMVEGMAEYLSVGTGSALTTMWMRDAILRERELPTARQLANSRKYFPYRYGHALWAYIAGRWGDEQVREIFLQTARTGSPAQAIGAVLQISLDTLSADWHEALRDAYEPVNEATMPPDSFGDPMLTEETVGGEVNVGAALSPNGEKVAFLNERSRFAIDLYVADAETGEVLQQLTRSAVDPHFQSLQFINSAGSWAPDNRRLAVTAIAKGKPVITVFDTETGERARQYALPGLGEAFNPTWSPSGDRIALVGNDGGYMDLYVLDTETGDLRALTDDPWTEVHPVWSPRGDRIAFVTDRFGGDLDNLEYGGYDLATIAPDGSGLERVRTFPNGRNTNPQWAPDGESLYFVSTRTGIANVYRHDLGSGSTRQLTDVQTGVSGITELSPALSVASESGKMAFSVFQEGAYNVYSTADEDRLAGTAPKPVPGGGNAAALPPLDDRQDGRLTTLLEETRLGLPAAETFARRDYDPSISLDYISQPSLGASVSSYGSFIGGGASLFFSDMLGYHSLSTQLQLSIQDGNVLNGIGALGQYVNQKHRTNWGVVGGQIPEITQGFRQGLADLNGDGQPEFIRETITFWQINRQALGLIRYPFSEVMRVEFSGGYNQIDFALETNRQVFAYPSGQKLADETTSAPACGDSLSFRRNLCDPAALHEGVAAAALVYDNSLAGPTGPIMGQRFRLEARPNVGTLNFLSATADYRRYEMPVSPLTLAGRLMHFGRWGNDARDERLSRLYLGYSQLIRGYSSGSFDVGVCDPELPLERCDELAVFSELFGTRIAVGNAEARLPLLGPLGVLSKVGNVPPIDLIGFFDAGVAWSSDLEDTSVDERAFFLGGDRNLLTSTGAGLRINLFGFALGEVHWVYPFDRPEKGGHFHFAINTGF